jgi:hypothetical protein
VKVAALMHLTRDRHATGTRAAKARARGGGRRTASIVALI